MSWVRGRSLPSLYVRASCLSPCTLKVPMLGWMPWGHHLEILNNFQQGDSRFHCALSSTVCSWLVIAYVAAQPSCAMVGASSCTVYGPFHCLSAARQCLGVLPNYMTYPVLEILSTIQCYLPFHTSVYHCIHFVSYICKHCDSTPLKRNIKAPFRFLTV